jgi:hypothetical protein
VVAASTANIPRTALICFISRASDVFEATG